MDASPDLSPPDFQSRGLAWSPGRPDVMSLLGRATEQAIEPIYYGSNHCFLLTLADDAEGTSLAVYKPARGEYPLYDFPSGSLYRREYGSWLVDQMLAWNLVPPTVIRGGQYGIGTVQLFIEAHTQGEIELLDLQRLALLDVILNNADRKADHLLVGDGEKLWAIDHGLTFHVQPKLRTVLWHFAGMHIPDDVTGDLERLARQLDSVRGECAARLRDLISRAEWRALQERVHRLVAGRRFPDPRYKPVPYRW